MARCFGVKSVLVHSEHAFGAPQDKVGLVGVGVGGLVGVNVGGLVGVDVGGRVTTAEDFFFFDEEGLPSSEESLLLDNVALVFAGRNILLTSSAVPLVPVVSAVPGVGSSSAVRNLTPFGVLNVRFIPGYFDASPAFIIDERSHESEVYVTAQKDNEPRK